MMLNAFYTCPQGQRVALQINALDDAPEIIVQPERTLFSACDDCEDGRRESGYCELKLGQITE